MIVSQMKRTKQGNLVIPLDDLRSIESTFTTLASGNFATSGQLATIGSGKEAYITQVILGPSAVSGSYLQLTDCQSGYQTLTPILVNPVTSETKVFDITIGPVSSGVFAASGSAHPGDVTLVLQIDPKVKGE